MTSPLPGGRSRMTAAARREQLIEISRAIFAERGYEGTAVEEIASRASVSKPVVYEHFGGKEGLYAVVVDREVRTLIDSLEAALVADHPRHMLEQAAVALLDYVEARPDGFRILVRDRTPGSASGQFATIMNDAVTRVEHILADQFEQRGYSAGLAPMYAQMLVGVVGHVGQWWLDVREPAKHEVAAHVVNLAWHGLAHLDRSPRLGLPPR
jgi:AcrR family transcriptional regulator